MMADNEGSTPLMIGDVPSNQPTPNDEGTLETTGDPVSVKMYGEDVVGERGPGDGRESGQEEAEATDEDDERSLLNTPEVTQADNDIVSGSQESNYDEAANGGIQSVTPAPCILPWGARKERTLFPPNVNVETDLRPGEFVMRTLFAEFTVMSEKKIDDVMQEPLERSLSKCLQRGEDITFDQLLLAFGNVAEQCLPSLLRTLFAWYARQGVSEWGSQDHKYKQDPNKKSSDSWSTGVEREQFNERRDLAVDFIFCLVLIEVLKQFPVHPGHDDLVKYIEDISFKHFKYREGAQNNPNGANINIISDLYAEVVGVLAQSRFQCIRRRFMAELKELRSKEASASTTQSITSLLMGMKFFRVKMVPIEEFEASFQFMQECAQYFIEVRDKDIKHALAGLFVEILVPVAATVKNEVNVPCLKNFVEMLYTITLDMATKNKHRLAIFPLVTCLLCVSQKAFFLSNWHYFLAMCLQHLKNRDPKMSRVALESLFRLLWVYMIRIKCESNSATQSRLASIVNSLFPKGSKAVVPRDTPLNIFVKIIQFIAQERLDFAMREIIFDLLSVGRKFILTPERMSIGLRAFLVVADNLQQKEGEPPMPRTVGVLPSGNTLRVKKTFLNKMLTEDTARNIGISAYYSLVRKSFNDILKALDSQFGKPMMMSNTQNVNKEPDDMITGERKPKIDLFRTCVAAIPRLIPDGMSGQELVDLLSRLTVHMDEELKALSFQSLQNLVIDFPEWRHDVVYGFIQFLFKEVGDTNPHLVDNGLRMLLQLLTAWKTALASNTSPAVSKRDPGVGELSHLHLHQHGDLSDVFYLTEGFALVMLCCCRQAPRRVAVAILREVKALSKILLINNYNEPVIDVLDRHVGDVLEGILGMLPPGERSAIQSTEFVDMQWLADRSSSIWTGGFQDDTQHKSVSVQHLARTEEVWPLVLVELLEKDRVFSRCPLALAHSWPIVYSRIKELYTIVDPMLPNENRASLLRSATQMKKPVNERDVYLNLWRNYIVVACRIVPAITKTPIMRCASPDISLGSSPDSGGGNEKGSEKAPPISGQCLYKILVPLLRCDLSDMRDTATLALGKINHLALGDLMEELLPYIRESIDRKQENMRRRRRRDAIRLQLVKLFEMCAEQQTFALCESVIDHNNGSLQKRYLEYIDGARAYLEGETDKDNTLMQIKMSFCNFVRKLIQSFSLEQRQTLMPRTSRRSLFYLFSSWSGAYGSPFGYKAGESSVARPTDFELCALQASTSVLCCGSCFDSQLVADDGNIYRWLTLLFNSNNEKVRTLAEETIVLLLEFNPDSGAVLDWVVDKCYTAVPVVADSCFSALATIFSAREYPCDHYTAVMNVTLLNTGCPRAKIHETALQLLQILDKRFFGAVSPIVDDPLDHSRQESSTLDVLLSATYSRSQLYLSKQLAHLHPELTMPMFSEISYRLQTARCAVRQLLFHCMLPWLYNMELVDPSFPPCSSVDAQYFGEGNQINGIRREGWGSAEATEMVLNNLFYITVKFGDENPKEIEDLWAAMSTCWPNNLRVIIRYLLIITAMAPQELLLYAKRVTVYVGRAKPDRLVEELISEIGTVETLNCVIERTETPPFFRLTSMRKTSSHEDGAGVIGVSNPPENEERGGTIHTKRHSGEQHQEASKEKYSPQVSREQGSAPGSIRSMTSMGSAASSVLIHEHGSTTSGILKQTTGGTSIHTAFLNPQDPSIEESLPDHGQDIRQQTGTEEDRYEPHPLPMPEYGGFFAPLTEYLPDSSQPITAFHRHKTLGSTGEHALFKKLVRVLLLIQTLKCNLAVMLICDVIVAGIDEDCHSVDWSIHIALMLHIITLGLDNSRTLVYQHCKILLIHLLTVVADHRDHLGVARVLLNNKTMQLGYGLIPHNIFVHHKSFTEEPPQENPSSLVAAPPGFDTPAPVEGGFMSLCLEDDIIKEESSNLIEDRAEADAQESQEIPMIVTHADETADTVSTSSAGGVELTTTDDLQFNIKALIDFIILSKEQPLWNFEDITSKQFSIKSAEQLSNFVRHIVAIFSESLPHTHIEERMAQIALHLALSCSSRHYAGRSLQVFRCLRVSMSSRMLSELLGRLVETVAEQGDDMQGYVTELMLTLEAAVDALHSDFRPIEFVRELFKSTPNLNNKERKGPPNYSVLNHYYPGYHVASTNPLSPHGGHFRSTSYTVSYGKVQPEMRHRSGTDADSRLRSHASNLSRSRSAQSLKQLADHNSADDKMTVLAQLFWIAVSMLESDYEYEFILAMRLLDKVLSRLSLDRPDCRDKVEKLQQQMKWKGFPGIHALLLKGCTSPATYEATISLLSRFTQMTDLQVVDPSQNRAFPINVIALLPYMLQHYEDANALCIQAAENIAQECNEKGNQLENLATVMTLYSRRNFSKESFQWTKCVVKYLHDSYAHITPTLMAFLVEVLEKGPTSTQNPILNILHCMLHYIDMNTTAAQLINDDLLRVIAKYIEGGHWKEALRILKLAVTRSSSLVVPPASSQTSYWDQHMFTDLEAHFKKELPGRTMEFTFDVTQTPIIGRRYLTRMGGGRSIATMFNRDQHSQTGNEALERQSVSPQRSLSLSAADASQPAGWKRPWSSQARVRERLVNLLNTCGQRVGLPKSPSTPSNPDGNINKVIFSQSSELERQSSMASSTEEVSVAPGDTTNDRTADDMTSSEKQFAVFKDFDFLEYELESQGEESIDNFNLWGVRRRSPSHDGEPISQLGEDLHSTPSKKASPKGAEWWEEEGSMSPSDDPSSTNPPSSSASLPPNTGRQETFPTAPSSSLTSPPKLTLDTSAARTASPVSNSDRSESSEEDLGDMTPCNTSPGIASLLFRPIRHSNELEEIWRTHLLSMMSPANPITHPHNACCLFNTVFSECVVRFCDIVADGNQYLGQSPGAVHFLKQLETLGIAAPLPYVFMDSFLLTSSSFNQKFRSTFIALQEHIDTYLDKQETALMCLDGLKSTLKLQSDVDEQQLELCRCLYKLHFQLTLQYETYTKFLIAMLQAAKTTQATDHSVELSALRGKLFCASEKLNTAPSTPQRFTATPTAERQMPEGEEEGEGESTGGEESEMEGEEPHSPLSFVSRTSASPLTPPISQHQAQLQLLQLIADQEWSSAVSFVRHHRSSGPQEVFSSLPLDDVCIISNVYCSYLAEKKPGMIALCSVENAMDDIQKQLSESNLSVLTALRSIEQFAKGRDSNDPSIRKTEC